MLDKGLIWQKVKKGREEGQRAKEQRRIAGQRFAQRRDGGGALPLLAA